MFSRQLLSRQVVARTALVRTTARVALPSQGSRLIMSEASLASIDDLSPPRQKLRQVLDEYRQTNFGQTLFSRFIKEMIIATDSNHDGKISKQEMRSMLKNIGVEKLFSEHDVDAVFAEIGHEEENGEYLIYTDDIENILTQPSSMSS